jgi:hypothetical protein
MKKHHISATFLVLLMSAPFALAEEETVCFESRKGASEVTQEEVEPGLPNVKCSPRTGGVLWWGDPYHATIPMGEMPIEADYSRGEAVVAPREPKNSLFPLCGVACHNGTYPPFPETKNPRKLTLMHTDIFPDSLNIQHGRGATWCLDCHHSTTRNKLVDHFGNEISFNEPQKLCGKCHGPTYRDWREGIHGKRIGEWASDGKKRWFVCTECHDPHDVQHGTRNSGFDQLVPEPAPILPKGMHNADHERHHGHSSVAQKGDEQH